MGGYVRDEDRIPGNLTAMEVAEIIRKSDLYDDIMEVESGVSHNGTKLFVAYLFADRFQEQDPEFDHELFLKKATRVEDED